jgi:hypothetical protein
MAFDQQTRNRLQRFVSDARKKLSEEFTRQLQNVYGLDPTSGLVTPLENLAYLDDTKRETARILRDTLEHYLATSPSEDKSAVLDRIVREQAFTVLNRLAALRMAEARGLLIESLANSYHSKGFQLYARLAGTGLGEMGDAYRCYLFSLFDEFALDLKVLFDRFSPFGRLFPREPVLLELLALINDPEIVPLWAEDETIGWIYQYFNSKEERKQMRDESSAPRNSRELAVRNQFFTPRYVVEFLTDNTLGRIWYEMTRGETRLKEDCRYLVRRPTEIFLEPGESAPESAEAADETLSQEELLKQPVYIAHRPLKDPREIRILDPACGSMHFGLYAFDLLEVIYEEAWDLQVWQGAGVFTRSAELTPLEGTYADKAAFLRDVPRLIVEHNIHGIDIDPRAVQIAGLSLWLRAQRAWQGQSVKAAERPQIRRSNIVCAEPMPGETSLLAEFLTKHFSKTPEDRLIGQLVRRVFEEMKLAGEAGSLLKIEEEIAAAIAEAKEQWQAQPKVKQETLFAEMAKPEQAALKFDIAGITDEGFWHEAEERIYAALREYAEAAEDGGYQKRLFAEDAARGFAFIDICRKRYDVVLMNPPFGACAIATRSFIESHYPFSRSDIYGAFVERGVGVLHKRALLGAITNRTGFFLKAFQQWRTDFVLASAPPIVFADLGSGVLDSALVETAAYCLVKSDMSASSTTFFKLIGSETPAQYLQTLIGQIDSYTGSDVFNISVSTFKSIEGSPFAYWTPKQLLKSFTKFKPFQSNGRIAVAGGNTGNNFRFVRTAWEISFLHNDGWLPYAKGGSYSPFYFDTHLCLNWKNNGQEMKAYLIEYRSSKGWSPNWTAELHGSEHYGRKGITWPRRTSSRLSARILPSHCVFGDKGPSAFVNDDAEDKLLALLAVMNTGVFQSLVELQTSNADAAARSYEVGIIQKTPVPILPKGAELMLAELALTIWRHKGNADSTIETSHAFLVPAVLQKSGKNLVTQISSWNARMLEVRLEVETIQREIEQNVAELYAVECNLGTFTERSSTDTLSFINESFDEEETTDPLYSNILSISETLCGWLIGADLGRWDIRFATSEKAAPELPDPFAPLPVCPPGMLQNEQGLPAEPKDVPDSYPLRISWQGILVDDQGHKEDIESRIQDALQVIWKERAENIESEACQILGVNSLRDYFRKPAAFFADHLKRYSKSRRQAPIYWPLSTASGSYTLWLYYHRLNDQTLYTCVVDFVEPKLRQVSETLNQLRGKAGNRSRTEEKELEFIQDLELELQEFRDELLRLAKLPWKPNLNDGVQITAAPLWKLFRLPKWQKTLKETWQTLEKGDYDWAHLAMTIWPDRVVPKCVKDRSLAIAHEVEELFWIEDQSKWRNLRTSAEEIQEQKKRQQSVARDRGKKLLTTLAASAAASLSAEQIRNHLANGDWDDCEIALRLYPERVAEKCWIDLMLAQRLGVEIPAKRTKAGFEKFARKLVSEGCAEIGQQLEAALKGRNQSFGEFWAELESGKHDDLEIALSLWSDRVIDKCAADVELATRHGVCQFFWVQHPCETWRKRQDPKVEVTNEITRRKTGSAGGSPANLA